MNARQSVTQDRTTSEYRNAERETGLGSKVIILSQTRSATRGHRHFSREGPTEIHMKVRAGMHTLPSDINYLPSLGRYTSGRLRSTR
jgi:hypothetical protein